MTENAPTKEQVHEAVILALKEIAPELARYMLTPFPDRLEPSFGGWLLPAEVRGPAATRKSYELHKLIERLEDLLHDRSRATITVDLLAASSGNGH